MGSLRAWPTNSLAPERKALLMVVQCTSIFFGEPCKMFCCQQDSSSIVERKSDPVSTVELRGSSKLSILGSECACDIQAKAAACPKLWPQHKRSRLVETQLTLCQTLFDYKQCTTWHARSHDRNALFRKPLLDYVGLFIEKGAFTHPSMPNTKLLRCF